MKKIISGKLCNTETAKKIGNYECGQPSQNRWYTEELYRTISGVYFIYGRGNAASPYAKASPDGDFSPNENIRIVSREAAEAWAEKHLSPDDYATIFGDGGADESRVKLTISISAAARKRLEEVKASSKKQLGEIVSEAIMNYTE